MNEEQGREVVFSNGNVAHLSTAGGVVVNGTIKAMLFEELFKLLIGDCLVHE